MSLTNSILIIGIIFIIIVGVLAVALYRRHLTNEINRVEEELISISYADIEEQLAKLEVMSFSGESLSTFSNWRGVFMKLRNNRLNQLEADLTDAAEQNANFNVFAAKKTFNEVETDFEAVKTDLENTREVFSELLQSNQDNQAQLELLLTEYQDLRKTVLTNSFDYGEALNPLEDKLTETEKDFDDVKTLSKEGDHVEAKRVLSRINVNVNNIAEMLPVIAKGHKELDEEFPAQFAELTETYKKMVENHYNFKGDDILDEIKDLKGMVSKSTLLLENLDTKNLVTNNQEIADGIDLIYDRLEKEIKDKKTVEREDNVLEKYLEHALYQNEKLTKKLEHIDQSYQLTHNELGESQEINDKILELQKDFQIDQAKMSEGKAIYSDIVIDFNRVNHEINEIENRQLAINNEVDGLFEAERIAKSSVEKFAQDVNLIKRKIDRAQLPGLPAEFIDFYEVVVREINDLNEELGKVRIDLEEISRRLIMVQEDINRLDTEADEIINSANLIEQTIQYANKYINEPEIKQEITTAMEHFQGDYLFKTGLDGLATALEKVDPGAFNRIERDYYKQHNHD